MSFGALKALKNGTMTRRRFDALLPHGRRRADPAEYGGDIKAWVKNDDNFARIMGLITLADPTGKADRVQLRRRSSSATPPMAARSRTRPTRLAPPNSSACFASSACGRRLGWTVEQTDAA